MTDNELLLALSNMMDKKLEPIHGRLNSMEGRLDKLESEVSALHVGQLEMKKDIKQMDKKVSDIISLH